MYQASTMSAQPMYGNMGMSYQPNQCSSYVQSCPPEYSMPSQGMVPTPWQPEYYQPQQQVPYAAAPQSKSLKRKPTNVPDRPSKIPYGQNPAFAFQQAATMMDSPMPSMAPQPDEYHLQPMTNLSPYRYSPTSSPYWPASGRPPSRSEMIRLELRNSLQAKQMANQQRQASIPADPVPQTGPPSCGLGLGAESLGFDLDITLKDSDGSLDSELDTVYDFNLGGGCGFDMENETTRCLVMKLLS